MATIKDVAAKSGVSVGTVSRVLNKRGYISQQTYQKVYAAMEALHYQPNQIARNLYLQRTYTIGLLLPDVSHPYFAELAHEIELLLYESGYKVFLCNTKENANREQDYIQMLQQNKVDGIIIGTHMLKDDVYETIRLPIVGMDIILGENIPCVHADHQKGGLLAAERLVQAGCRNVLQLSGYSAIHSPALIRHQVFEDVCREHGVNCITHELESNEFKRESYCQIIHSLLDQYPSVDGFFSTDIIVAYALRCAFDRGIKVPEQFKAIGYDGVELARFLTPPLTYIQQPIRQLSEVLVETLLKKINGEDIPEPEIILPDIWLVEGGTV
ncbi:MAG: LacI family transcriptional regulator [Ruminococcus sp.]|jgi:DNA-binding LacI/PurR family transcriptional regulator|uniref:LacI family DNA-binding transcriptional regulator n=1 Tax=Schaedlerella arabinosiphila TaxID=2044587 RepID=UPI002557E002|nr:LacI family DNA-binding transcriptional regulator [Schaedlerella arabinosiphila]MCI9603514.1 LacI family transcriptional regulator [Ruminococcus sp.]